MPTQVPVLASKYSRWAQTVRPEARAKTLTFATGTDKLASNKDAAGHNMRRFRGFTLIELLVVFAIIGLLIAVVPVAFDRLRASAQYTDTVRALVSDLRAARFQAQSQGRDVLFLLHLQERNFGIAGGAVHTLPEGVELRAEVGDLGQPGAQEMGIRFLPNGGASGGSIEVLRAAGVGTRLRVDWLSGRVSHEALLR